MEFEEMKKIWDEQNKQTMYAIDETALHKRIKAKGNLAIRTANKNEIGLMAIAVITASILLFIKEAHIYNQLTAGAMLLMGLYVFIGRVKRLRKDKQYDRTMLGEIDRAIANIQNEAKRAKTFIFWMIIPVAIPSLIKIIIVGAPFWKITLQVGLFGLAFLLTQWDWRKVQTPRMRELEVLREKLITD